MKNLSFLLMFLLLFCASAFAQKNVAVLEIERRANVVNEISREEAMEITNVIRSAAVRTLPRARYSVMTSETVQSMSGAVLADCADESCIITIGRRIDADYIVRGTLSKFQTRFTLHIEMYETDYGNLIATADPIRSANLEEILEKSGQACADMYREFLGIGTQTAVTPPQAVSAPPPSTPVTVTSYTLSIISSPAKGSTISRDPDLPRYAAGTRVAMTATPASGYRFVGWTNAEGRIISENPILFVVMDRDGEITARFQSLRRLRR